MIESQRQLISKDHKLDDLLAQASISRPLRFKLSEEALIYLNDLEKDAVYAQWPKEQEAFLQPSPTGIYRVALNAVTAILCVDPSQEEGLQLAKEALKWVKTGIPIRFGLLLVNDKQSDEGSLRNKFLYGHREALSGFYAALDKTEIDEAKSDAGAPAQFEAARMQQQLSLKSGCILINGRLIEIKDVLHAPRDILTAYREEIQLLQESLALDKELNHKLESHRNPKVKLDDGKPVNLAILGQEDRDWLLSDKPYLLVGTEPKLTVWFAIDMEMKGANRIIDELEKVYEAAKNFKLPAFRLRLLFPASQQDTFTANQMIAAIRIQGKKTGFSNIKVTWDKLRHSTKPALHSPRPADTVRLGRKQRANKESIEAEKALQEELLEQFLGRSWQKGEDLAVMWINGMRVAEVSPGDRFLYADWEQILRFEEERKSKLVDNAAVGTILQATREQFFGLMTSLPAPNLRSFEASVEHGNKNAPLQIEAVLDPLSRTTQRLLSLAQELKDLVHLRIILNPSEHTSTPNLYRWHKDPLASGNLPALAVKIDAPPTWNLQRSGAGDYDAMPVDETAEYKLESFAMEAWLPEPLEGRDPRGKPIELGAFAEFTQASDGRVSKPYALNMGYLQVSSLAGGSWSLEADSHATLPTSLGLNRHRLPAGIKLNITKEGKGQSGVINVFSIASGLTYERMIRIMILSVMKRTNEPVHLWLVDNFASRDFKQSVDAMAKELGFTLSWLNYRWPSWLHAQQQLHREVWAYKILFLDAMFPESVDRIIYIDADQVVRGDLADLRDLDMEGKPYGMVPFCEDGGRPDTEGYRFWKGGFWEKHLRGATYHISALLVVDLVAFRRLGVGHRLRQHYHLLSHDPNSLANLDQDLPNYLQTDIPIYSLPQEWLWCETWCGEASKPKAKSIDLCSHPDAKRHESKLEQAKRIIKEWSALDKQVLSILDKQVKSKEEL